MKTLLTTLITAVVGLVALPDTAEARPHCGTSHSSYTYRSGSASCGCSIYTKRIFNGYDCYHRPIYRYTRVPLVHRCHSIRSHYNPHYRSHRGYRHSRHYRHARSHRGHSSHINLRTRYGSVRICR